MNASGRASLSRQLLVPFVGLVAVLAGLAGLAGWRQMNRQLDAQLEERARTVMRAIQFSAGAIDSRESMIRMMRVLAAGGDVERVLICARDPLRAVVSTHAELQGMPVEQLPESGVDAGACAFLLSKSDGEFLRHRRRAGRFVLATRLQAGAERRSPLAGSGVLIELPTAALQRQIRESMARTMAGVFAIGALGAAGFGWLLRSRVLRPLAQLTEEAGRTGGTVATPPGAAREIATLADSLSRAFAAVTEINRELEQRVRDRTAELVTLLDREREAGRLRTDFIGMVSHEYRNSLATILSSTQLLARYRDRFTPEEQDRHLAQITASCHRLTALVEDVLLYSRTESNRIELNPGPVNLPAFCRVEVAEAVRNAGGDAGRVVFIGNEGMELVRLDEQLLHHALSNLLSNAVKYSPVDRPVELELRRDGGRAVFTVRDRGIGIPADELPRLGAAFRRGRNVGDCPGTGLGLVMVRRCLDLLGGELRIDSIEGEGTTAIVTLPVDPGAGKRSA